MCWSSLQVFKRLLNCILYAWEAQAQSQAIPAILRVQPTQYTSRLLNISKSLVMMCGIYRNTKLWFVIGSWHRMALYINLYNLVEFYYLFILLCNRICLKRSMFRIFLRHITCFHTLPFFSIKKTQHYYVRVEVSVFILIILLLSTSLNDHLIDNT